MKKKYVAPQTEMSEVELENGFMSSASVFDDANKNDEGASINAHEIGNSGDYFTDDPLSNPDDKYKWD